MFLSGNQYTPSHFDYLVGHGVSCDRMAVEAEISYLSGVDTSNVVVDMTGTYVVLEGTVASVNDAAKIERVAESVVGAGRVMSRLISVGAPAPFRLLA
jgi:F420-0:gamma-glutamyl ligase-like protein